MTKILKLSNDVKISKSNIDIVKVEKNYTNVACSVRSNSGLYYSKAVEDISMGGYTLLSYQQGDFGNCSCMFAPYISDSSLYFISQSSMTIGRIDMTFFYIRD